MPDQELIDRLQAARAKASSASEQRARAEANAQAFKDQVMQLAEQIRADGVEPAQLDATITDLEAQLAAKIEELEEALNG